jgi:hypothetical protein
MKLIIFGATGQVGKDLVQLALFEKHQVKAFGRNVFTENFLEHENLDLVKGALFDEKQVAAAVRGSDAVLSVIGGAFDGTDQARSLGMKNIVQQMKNEGVQRIIALGGKGQLDTPDGHLLMDDPSFPPEYLPVSLEHKKALDILSASGLQWTFICSPDIRPGSPTGGFHTAANLPPDPDHGYILTGDLALFMLQELNQNEFIQKKVGISN